MGAQWHKPGKLETEKEEEIKNLHGPVIHHHSLPWSFLYRVTT